MKKTDIYSTQLAPLFEDFFSTNESKKLIDFLLSHSSLPGRRANLELANAFQKVIKETYKEHSDVLWEFISFLIDITPDQAPTGNPKEFLPFCGTWALGSIGTLTDNLYIESILRLKKMANDPRWRIREAVAKGLQRLLENNSAPVIEELESWISDEEWLIMRAVIAGIAEPKVLTDRFIKTEALKLHKNVMDKVKICENRKTDDFQVLLKGLGYSLSVVVHTLPKRGFEYLEELANSRDPDIIWILKQNLQKNRLKKAFPAEVNNILKQLT